MEISIRHIGSSAGHPARCIELTVNDYGNILVSDITDLKGRVDEDFIQNLRDIADELEEQNKLIDSNKQ